MANIYIQLPTPICHFHRFRDRTKLSPFAPVKFSEISEHYIVMSDSLAIFRDMGKSKSFACYSQQQWKNVLFGRTPDGSKQVVKRDPTVWPTYEDICTIEGKQLRFRSDSYDYLCVQIPPTIIRGGRMLRTNQSYTLGKKEAYDLQNLLVRDFKRALVNYELATQAFCIQRDRVIKRERMDTLERFMLDFDLPCSQDGSDKDSLRRQMERWLQEAKIEEKAYRTLSINYIGSQDIVIKHTLNCK